MNELKTYAEILIEEAQRKAQEIAVINEHGRDIANNALCAINYLKPYIDDLSDFEELAEIVSDVRLVLNKMRCFQFSPDLDNVQLNQLVSGNFIKRC